MEKEKQLEQLGLSEKESKIYLKALEMGVFSASSIATVTGIKRPTCYVILSELINRGLIINVPRAKKALFTAEDPEILLSKSREQANIAENLVPTLKQIRSANATEPLIKYYSGRKGIQTIFDDMLKCKEKKYYFIGSGQDVINVTGKEYIDKWLKKRIEKNLKAISIRMKKTEVPGEIYQNMINRELRLAPDNIHIPETVHIYDDKVAFISTTKENFGFVVSSKDFSETMKVLFNALWSISDTVSNQTTPPNTLP